jgi:DNA-directed RNA polymerase sigma subunit (sigma70/sigma32)
VSTSKLQSANADAVQKVLNQMRQDGKITAAQETRIEKQLQNASKHPCATLRAAVSRAHAKGGKVAPALGATRQQIETAVAGALNLPVATLQQDLTKGQTVAQIAAAQKVSISTVNTAYINAVKSALASAQSKGLITQQESSTLLNRIQQAVNAGHYPGLPVRGPKGPAAPPAPANTATSTAQQ